MLIHLALASDTPKSLVRRDELKAMYACSEFRRHTLTDDPAQADLILLAGDLESLTQARANPLLKRFPEKTFAYSEIDALVPYAPGVYGSASIPSGLNLRRTQGGIYFSRYGSSQNPHVRHRPQEARHLLFCFLGRRDCRVRSNILAYPYHRPDVHVLETTAFMHWNQGIVGDRSLQQAYADILANSHFALCPRGMGLGSIRLFEVLEMGIAPVLLSDRYALPPGPDWDSFLLRVPERDFDRLPAILERHRAESEARGHLARQAWEQFFAPEIIFDRLIDQLTVIRGERLLPEQLLRLLWPLFGLRMRLRAWILTGIHAVRHVRKQRIA